MGTISIFIYGNKETLVKSFDCTRETYYDLVSELALKYGESTLSEAGSASFYLNDKGVCLDIHFEELEAPLVSQQELILHIQTTLEGFESSASPEILEVCV